MALARRTLILAFAASTVFASVPPHVAAAAPRIEAARRGADWIASEQEDDGAFFTSGQRVDQAAEALTALVAGGGTGRPVDRALAYIRRKGAAGASRGAYTGRIVAALVATGEDPRTFGGTDYVAKLTGQYDERTGAYDAENLFSDLQGANGALAAGTTLPSRAIERIYANGCSDGGFGYENACARGADTDTTAWAVNVLVGAGRKGDARVTSARAFLLSAQRSDGGFGFTKTKSTSADSTGLVLSAIEALGEKATAAPWRRDDGDDPVKVLLSLQNTDGSFRFVDSSRDGNALSTTNAVPGLAGVAYPVPRLGARSDAAPPSVAPSARPASGGGSAGAGAGSVAGVTGTTSPTPSSTFSPPASATEAAAPFDNAAAQDSQQGPDGLPAPVVWGGLGAIAAGAGGSVWWLLRRGIRR